MVDFTNLSLEQRRNEFNKEIISLLYVIDTIRGESNNEYYNYPENTGVTEEEFLKNNYNLIYQAREKLTDIFKD